MAAIRPHLAAVSLLVDHNAIFAPTADVEIPGSCVSMCCTLQSRCVRGYRSLKRFQGRITHTIPFCWSFTAHNSQHVTIFIRKRALREAKEGSGRRGAEAVLFFFWEKTQKEGRRGERGYIYRHIWPHVTMTFSWEAFVALPRIPTHAPPLTRSSAPLSAESHT